MSNNRFQYQFARDQQIQQLRNKCQQLYQQKQTLQKSLEELMKVNTQLTESIQEFNNMHLGNLQQDDRSSRYKGQSMEDMQNKIDMLTMELQMLRSDVGNNNQNNNDDYGQANNQHIMNMVQQMLISFKNVQDRYQTQIEELKNQIRNYQGQWGSILQGIALKSQQKFTSLDKVVKQLRKKDQAVDMIQNKIRNIQNNSSSQSNFNQYGNINPSQLDDIKNAFDQQLLEKDRTIIVYKDLIAKLKKKLSQKF